MPKASIIIPTLNRAEYLGEAIASALGQTFADIEVVVVDNASDDPGSIEEVCRRYDDPRLKWFRYEERLAPGGSWSRAIVHAEGEFAKLLCDDDLLSPYYVERAIAAFEWQPHAVLFTCAWDKSTSPSVQNCATRQVGDCHWIPPDAVQLLSYLDYAGGGLPTLTMFRMQEILMLSPPFDSGKYLDVCDSAAWNQLLKMGGLLMHKSTLAVERLHAGQLQRKWTAAHYRKVYGLLKRLLWEGFEENVKKKLPNPEDYVAQLELLMRVSGRFPRRFRFTDILDLPGALRTYFRIRKKSLAKMNATLVQFGVKQFCEVREL